MQGIRASANCRVDLAGGTLDIWPLGILHPGARTINVAVEVKAMVDLVRRNKGYRVVLESSDVEVETLGELVRHDRVALIGLIAEHFDLPPVEIRLSTDSPRGAGLGGSSALAVALIAASESYLERRESSAHQRSRLARDLEARLMGLPTGCQDHYPALLGGVLEICYRPGGDEVRRLAVDLEKLGNSLLVAYTGKSHLSAANNWQVIRRRLDGDPESIELFERIAAVARELRPALESGDLETAGHLMESEWSLRRRLAPAVATPAVEKLLRVACASGSWGGKACGAGGGGCIATLVQPDRRGAVIEALLAAGAEVLAARPSSEEVQVSEL